MPLGDVAQKNAVLDAMFGAGHASSMGSSHTLHLFTGNPYAGGVETDYPGYAAQTVANDSGWPAAADAAKTREVTFPAATAAATNGDVLCWVLKSGTAITAWEFLDGPLSIGEAGAVDPIGVTVYIPDDANVTA